MNENTTQHICFHTTHSVIHFPSLSLIQINIENVSTKLPQIREILDYKSETRSNVSDAFSVCSNDQNKAPILSSRSLNPQVMKHSTIPIRPSTAIYGSKPKPVKTHESVFKSRAKDSPDKLATYVVQASVKF